MSEKKVRNNDYWLERLRKEYPDVLSRFNKGEIESVHAARIEAGLLRQPQPIDILQREWKKTSPLKRTEFLDWVESRGSKSSGHENLTNLNGYLSAKTIHRINRYMKVNKARPGHIMTEMDYKSLNPNLGLALAGRLQPSKEFLDRLGEWMKRHPL